MICNNLLPRYSVTLWVATSTNSAFSPRFCRKSRNSRNNRFFSPSRNSPESSSFRIQSLMEHSHKAGSLKQTNKSHKQVKNSKRATKLSMGGRVESGGRLSIKEKWEERRVR